MGFIHISAFKHSFAKSLYCSFMNSFYLMFSIAHACLISK